VRRSPPRLELLPALDLVLDVGAMLDRLLQTIA
jgi:hypothetical protein